MLFLVKAFPFFKVSYVLMKKRGVFVMLHPLNFKSNIYVFNEKIKFKMRSFRRNHPIRTIILSDFELREFSIQGIPNRYLKFAC